MIEFSNISSTCLQHGGHTPSSTIITTVPTPHSILLNFTSLLEDVNSYPRMDVEENTPAVAPAVEVSDAPKGKMSVEDALQEVLKNAMVRSYHQQQ
jgi:hypothetical protein